MRERADVYVAFDCALRRDRQATGPIGKKRCAAYGSISRRLTRAGKLLRPHY